MSVFMALKQNNLTKEKKQREMNLELLRIISMVMVVTLHYMSHGSGLSQNKVYSVNWFFSWTIDTLSMVSVNCFVLISGYFLVQSKFKLKKIIQLWLQVLFYSIGIYIILAATGLINFNIIDFGSSCLPVLLSQYWFAQMYIALYIFSPFLNILIHSLNKNQMRNLLMILFFMLSLCPTILPFGTTVEKGGGYSITHFMFLYLIASYIRLYWNSNKRNYHYICGYLLLILFLLVSRLVLPLIGLSYLLCTFYQYNSLPVILASICLFMFFRGISIKNNIVNKIVKSISGLTFAVYLIHDNNFIRNTLYKEILHTTSFGNTPLFIPITISSIVGVFVVCIFIDSIRYRIFILIENSKPFDYTKTSLTKLWLKLSPSIYANAAQNN
ncbi:acyltransferase [Inconstantimicrobium mannanitabidum]|uniref:Membrane protein n=1 Tax=Inconstantimicrobium mannanitabidum TaxID=1604901 RepID=A0ACB5RF95_9CLOT|nr:acyltransferase [Clostridium sp. TW13]GKX67546.1 membrane protein [Clostridium sp. TW13]